MRNYLSSQKVKEYRTLIDDYLICEEGLPRCMKLFKTLKEAQDARTSPMWIAESDNQFGLYNPVEGYMSVFCYDKEEILAYKEANHGSLSGYQPSFTGNSGIFTDWLIIDIDSGENGIDRSIKQAYGLLYFLILNKIHFKLFTSGFKGIHIYIPLSYFIYPDSFNNYKHEVCLAAAQYLKSRFELKLDLSIYNLSSMIRRPYSLNPKSERPKILLEIDMEKYADHKKYTEFCSPVWMNTNEIKMLIKHLTEPYEAHAKFFEISPVKRTMYVTHTADIDKSALWRYSGSMDSCVINMLNDTKPSERHNALLRIMSALYLQGFPPKIAAGIMIDWASKLEPQPGKESYTKQTILDELKYWGQYTYACNDHYRQKYCNQSCKKYRSLSMSNEILSSNDYAEAYAKHLTRVQTDDIDMSMIFPGLNLTVMPDEAHIVGIVAAPGVGKTMMLCQLMLGMTSPVLFFSYEMNRLSIAKMFCKQLGMDPLKPDIEALKHFTSHIYIEDSGMITPDDYEFYIRSLEERNRIKFKAICLDFIQQCPVKDPNYPTRIINNEVEAMARITKVAKSNGKKMKVAQFYLSQVTKEDSAGNEPLRLMDAKGSQQLPAICDIGITLWRPHMVVDREDVAVDTDPDDVLTMFVDKDRVSGWEKKYINYKFNRQTLLLNELYDKPVKDKKIQQGYYRKEKQPWEK